MRTIHGYQNVASRDRGASVAIGNFDGVHRGHQQLIRDAADVGGPIGVVTFEPHPRRFFQPDLPSFRLTPVGEKSRRLESHGIDLLYNLSFDGEMASMAARDFVQGVLVDGLGITHIVAGADFRFGKGRAGGEDLLRAMGAELGFGVTIQPLIGDETGDYASSAIRTMVADGACEDAARQLGCWHTVSGAVIKGDQRGRDMGYPTANLSFGEQMIPRYGIYATWVDVLSGPHQGRHAGVASIGERPTFGINAPNFEVHLFDFTGDLYDAMISVSLVRYLRGEVKFEGIDALIRQMDQDSTLARGVLKQATLPQTDNP